jgi:hypothetical protein
MPGWLRVTATRDILNRTALRADARGIAGSSSVTGHCPWRDITHIVIWQYNYLKIVGVVQRADMELGEVASGTTAQPSARKRKQHRGKQQPVSPPPYQQIIAPDGVPFGAGNLVTTNGWGVGEMLKSLHLPWRRLLWALGVAVSVATIVSASDRLKLVGSLVLLVLVTRWVFVLRRRWRAWRSSRPAAFVGLVEDPMERDS